MSKKTMKQRIALVAVTALTAGVLSVATSPVANAAINDITVNTGVSTVLGAGGLAVPCSVYDAVNDSFGADLAQSINRISTLAVPLNITVPVGGQVNLNVEGTAAGGGFITYTSAFASDDTTAEINHNQYGVTAANLSIDDDTLTLTATAVGTITVNAYASAPFSAVNTANTILATKTGVLTITVVAACPSLTYSPTFSQYRVDNTAFAAGNANLLITYGDTLTFGAGGDGFISIIGKNGNNATLPATTSWVASATNNAKVLLGTSSTTIGASTTARGTLSSVSTTAAGTSVYVRVTPESRTAGGTTTVTVSADGVQVLSKTLTFLPEATKLVILKNLTGSLVNGDGAFLYELQTATGTAVPGAVAVRPLTLDSRVTSVTALASAGINPAIPGGTIAIAAGAVATATVLSLPTTKYGISKFACNTGSTSGSTKVTLRHTTPVTEANIDTEVTLSCAGGVATYTISTDKAAYKIGEVATITVTAKDSTGVAVSDLTLMPTADALSVGGGTLVKNTAVTDGFSGGVKTYSAQMTTAGTFNIAAIISGSVTKSATTGYSVSSATTEVTNAEVLKSIVALIASINKQIAALQKLILKR